MGIWTIPSIIVGILLVIVSYFLTAGVMKRTRQRESAMDTPVNKVVKEHPLAANPIIIMYVIFLTFLGIIIFYYWAKYGY